MVRVKTGYTCPSKVTSAGTGTDSAEEEIFHKWLFKNVTFPVRIMPRVRAAPLPTRRGQDVCGQGGTGDEKLTKRYFLKNCLRTFLNTGKFK